MRVWAGPKDTPGSRGGRRGRPSCGLLREAPTRSRTIAVMASPSSQPLDRATARRFLAARHLLLPPRALPAETGAVLRVIERLGSLQFDPLEVAGRNHDLVLARPDRGLSAGLDGPLAVRGAPPVRDLQQGPLDLPDGRAAVVSRDLGPVPRLPRGRRLRRARRRSSRSCSTGSARDGPLLGHATSGRAPRSTGTGGRRTRSARSWKRSPRRGSWGIARREGNRRIYDLAERLFPPELLADGRPERDQRRHRCCRGTAAGGLLGALGQRRAVVRTAPAPGTPGDRPADPGRAAGRAGRGRRARAGRRRGVKGERFVLADGVDACSSAESRRPATRRRRRALPSWRRWIRSCWDRDLLRRALRLRLRLGGLRPGGQAALGLLRPADPVRRPPRRTDRAADRPPGGRPADPRTLVGGGFDPIREDEFVDALVAALDAHARFTGGTRIALPRTLAHRAVAAAIRERLGRGGQIDP